MRMTAIAELLTILELSGAIVTIDAHSAIGSNADAHLQP